MMGNTTKRELQDIYIPKIRSQKYHYPHDKSPITLSRSIGGCVAAQLNSPSGLRSRRRIFHRTGPIDPKPTRFSNVSVTEFNLITILHFTLTSVLFLNGNMNRLYTTLVASSFSVTTTQDHHIPCHCFPEEASEMRCGGRQLSSRANVPSFSSVKVCQ